LDYAPPGLNESQRKFSKNHRILRKKSPQIHIKDEKIEKKSPQKLKNPLKFLKIPEKIQRISL
jgi:hypothetical protein